MLIASDPSTGRLMVLTPLSNSPAARAGVQSGDEATPLPLHAVQCCNSMFGKGGEEQIFRMYVSIQQLDLAVLRR